MTSPLANGYETSCESSSSRSSRESAGHLGFGSQKEKVDLESLVDSLALGILLELLHEARGVGDWYLAKNVTGISRLRNRFYQAVSETIKDDWLRLENNRGFG